VIAGATVLGAGWIMTALPEALCELLDYHFHGEEGSKSSSWPLLIPLAGPWAQLAANAGDHVTPPVVNVALAMDGVMQAAGLVMLITGAVSRTRPDAYARRHIGVAPLLLRGGSGLAALGTF
jgi:hypothetical protein